MTRVLVVDDEPQIRRALATNLGARGYDVDLAATGEDALRLAAERHPDVVVLDLGLPGIDGVEVVRGLRGWSTVPIIMLSVREGEADKVDALDAGADDYLTKPFGMDELLARLRAARAAGDAGRGAAGRGHRRLHRRPGGQAGRPRRRGGAPHPDRVGAGRAAGAPSREAGQPAPAPAGRSGARSTRPRPTTCACTWPDCDASSSPTRASPGTSSPSRAWATGSRPPPAPEPPLHLSVSGIRLRPDSGSFHAQFATAARAWA